MTRLSTSGFLKEPFVLKGVRLMTVIFMVVHDGGDQDDDDGVVPSQNDNAEQCFRMISKGPQAASHSTVGDWELKAENEYLIEP